MEPNTLQNDNRELSVYTSHLRGRLGLIDPSPFCNLCKDNRVFVSEADLKAHKLSRHSSKPILFRRPVRILSLDNGGLKGLSSLVILKELMAHISRRCGSSSELRPCDYFDLICGTGTGGLIAIMLGSLQLNIDSAIQVYIKIHSIITTCDKDPERNIKEVLSETVSDDPPYKNTQVNHIPAPCRTFVLAVRPNGTRKEAVRMRSYGTDHHDPFDAKTSQVALAILAAPGILSPININGINYAEASEWPNPIMEARDEANMLWPNMQADFISIGTGIEDARPLSYQQPSFLSLPYPQSDVKSLNSKLLKRTIELSETSERIQMEFSSNQKLYAKDNGLYVRFNIHYGISAMGFENWEASMPSYVKDYVESFETQKQLNRYFTCQKTLSQDFQHLDI